MQRKNKGIEFSPFSFHPPYFWDNYAIKISGQGESCGSEYIGVTAGNGPDSIKQEREYAVSASWSSNTGISVGVVQQSFNFSVTGSVSITDSADLIIPDGKSGSITSYPMYMVHRFDVYKKDQKIGNGQVSEPKGICFVKRID